MSWSALFAQARIEEAESDALVADFIASHKPASSSKSDEEVSSEASSLKLDSIGAFKQPQALANFTTNVALHHTDPIFPERTLLDTSSSAAHVSEDPEATLGHEPITPARDMTEVLSRQICRTWLKYQFLGSSQECTGAAAEASTTAPQTGTDASLGPCGRRHSVPPAEKVGSLYKDYSFKGLPAKHRKKIIETIVSGSGIVSVSGSGSLAVTAAAAESDEDVIAAGQQVKKTENSKKRARTTTDVSDPEPDDKQEQQQQQEKKQKKEKKKEKKEKKDKRWQ